MEVRVFESLPALAREAAAAAAAAIAKAVESTGEARVVAATGVSQLAFLEALTARELPWSKLTLFHLDEYVGLPESHPASFRRYLRQRIIDVVHPGAFHLIDGEAADPEAECRRVGALYAERPPDVAFVGIGENGHLAFNDPPADFETDEPYIVVELDEACRRQQLGEGWFESLEQVPPRAISMSIRGMLAAREILCIVPEARKARAVRECLEGEIGPERPASALRSHEHATVYLDPESAALLSPPPKPG
jgi:glucosamine-6-phosphate deaminase